MESFEIAKAFVNRSGRMAIYYFAEDGNIKLYTEKVGYNHNDVIEKKYLSENTTSTRGYITLDGQKVKIEVVASKIHFENPF